LWENLNESSFFLQMLNCILGMVEKTQRAITILQQRQSAAASLRTTEDLVEEVQNRAIQAVSEVKAAAIQEIQKARSELWAVSGRRPRTAVADKDSGLLRVSTSMTESAEVSMLSSLSFLFYSQNNYECLKRPKILTVILY
jgi:hypothetical protein